MATGREEMTSSEKQKALLPRLSTNWPSQFNAVNKASHIANVYSVPV